MAATTMRSVETDQNEDYREFVLFKGNGVKGLSDVGLKILPQQYTQPIEERTSSLKIVPKEHYSIPIINMMMNNNNNNNNNNNDWEEQICDAAEKWGFFQIVNHGVPLQVLENVKKATYRFYEMPAEEKMKYTKEKSGSNNVRYGTSFNPIAEKALEWKDYLSLFYVSDNEAASFWPPACRDEALEYMKKTESVIKKILQVLMRRLNVKEFDETKESLLMGSKRINLNYYPICPNPDLAVALGRHSDVSTLTLLLQDETGGLFVRAEGHSDLRDRWIHVSPMAGSLVVNIGDALQIMSNGRYKSVEHRVAANGSKVRVSVPIFVNPKPSHVIGPLQEVLASGEKAMYKNVLYSDYVKHFFKKPHDGKTTVEFARV